MYKQQVLADRWSLNAKQNIFQNNQDKPANGDERVNTGQKHSELQITSLPLSNLNWRVLVHTTTVQVCIIIMQACVQKQLFE